MTRLPIDPQTDLTRPPETVQAADVRIEHLVAEMTLAWQRGGRVRAEELIDRHGWLAEQPEAALRLVYEEYCLGLEHGEEPSVDALVRRFPQWQDKVRVMLEAQQLLGLGPTAPQYPAPGQRLEDFTIETELGRGAQGRVFLARQSSLANRLLVLKLTPCEGHEHLSLARLQHTHIAPLYWAQDLPERYLRVLCMPFLGNVTLSRVLDELEQTPPAQRRGLDLRRVLDRGQLDGSSVFPVPGPDWERLAALPYVQAVCWLGVCLADALHYAHQRGLVHFDIKPSNVLLASDGQPFILDFHLARPPLAAGETIERLGGSLGYMAPEHETAVEAVERGRPMPETVDGRADQFGLGLVLYELLAGRRPEDGVLAPQRLPQLNPHVSLGLADVLTRSLATAAAERYPDAAAFAADLRRHIEDLPLQGVPNRSWRERWRKWRRRRPYELAILATLLVTIGGVLTGAVLGAGWFVNQWQEAELALAQGKEQLRRGDFTNAALSFAKGKELADALPGGDRLATGLDEHFQGATRAGKVIAVHDFAENLRFHTAVEPLPARIHLFVDGSGHHWREREAMLRRLGMPLEEALEHDLRTDLLDLAVVAADLKPRLVPPERQPDAHRASLKMLREAETLFGGNVVLTRQQWAHTVALGDRDAARALEQRAQAERPRTSWEAYALGRFWLFRGELAAALPELERAVDLDPLAFFPHFYLGICLDRCGEPARAVAEFTFCAGRQPRFECLFHRGRSNAAAGQLDAALKDFSLALQLAPTNGLVALHRARVQQRRHQLQAALDDLQFALEHGAPPADVFCARAAVQLERQDLPAARASLARALQADPQHAGARALQPQLAPPR